MAPGKAGESGAGRGRSGIGREPCCAQLRCAGIRGIVRAAKGAAHSRGGAADRINSQVGSLSEAPEQGPAVLASVWAGFYPSGTLQFLLRGDAPKILAQAQRVQLP